MMGQMENNNGTPPGKNENEEPGFPPPENAFLIIDGTKVVPLNQSTISIGRSLDNVVVIDDPRVSRHHMQLRVINGHFVLFDLNSSGGTFLNGQRTNQAVIYAGDLISLAGVKLAFVHDISLPSRSQADTSPFQPGMGQHATAILRTMFFNKKKKGD
jgi:pSer/pThr/pTyr-binding forkhead associated (FHA) protein